MVPLPAITAREVGVDAMVKSRTLSVAVTLRVIGLLVPVTVSESFCAAAEVAAQTFIVDVPAPPVTVAGLKVALIPVGGLLKLSATFPVNPWIAVTVMVKFTQAPRFTGCEAGLTDNEKSFTTSVIVVVWTVAPLVPVIVRV